VRTLPFCLLPLQAKPYHCQRCAAQRTRSGAWKLPTLSERALGVTCGHIRPLPLPAGIKFDDHWDILLLLDNREQFAHTSGSRKVARPEAMSAHAERLRTAGLAVELRSLPVGDVLWVARCKRSFPSGPPQGVRLI